MVLRIVKEFVITYDCCSICGGTHESGCCIPLDDAAKEVNYMGNQNRQGFHSDGFSGY